MGYNYFLEKCDSQIRKQKYLEAIDSAILIIRSAGEDLDKKQTGYMMLGHAYFLIKHYNTALQVYQKAENTLSKLSSNAHIDNLLGCKNMILYLLIYFKKSQEAEKKYIELYGIAFIKEDSKIFNLLTIAPLYCLMKILPDISSLKKGLAMVTGIPIDFFNQVIDGLQNFKEFAPLKFAHLFLINILLKHEIIKYENL